MRSSKTHSNQALLNKPSVEEVVFEPVAGALIESLAVVDVEPTEELATPAARRRKRSAAATKTEPEVDDMAANSSALPIVRPRKPRKKNTVQTKAASEPGSQAEDFSGNWQGDLSAQVGEIKVGELARISGIEPSSVIQYAKWAKFLAACDHEDVNAFMEQVQESGFQLQKANYRIGFLESQLNVLTEAQAEAAQLRDQVKRLPILERENISLNDKLDQLSAELELMKEPAWKRFFRSLGLLPNRNPKFESGFNEESSSFHRALRRGLSR